MNEVGAYIQTDGGSHLEFRDVRRVVWAAFHARRALRNALWHLLGERKVLPSTVFASLAWPRGTRLGTAPEVQGLRTLQVRVTISLGRSWPRGAEAWPDYARRTTRWAAAAWRMARNLGPGDRSRSVAMGRALGTFEPHRAMETVCGGRRAEGRLVAPDLDPGRSRLPRGHRAWGARC